MNIVERIRRLFPFKPATAGELEVTMSDTTTTPANGGLTEAQVSKIFEAQINKVLGPLVEATKANTDGLKAMQEAALKAPAPLKAEDLATLVTKQLAEHQKAQADASTKSQAKAALREKVIAAKLPGVPKSLLANLPDTEDEAALNAAADALRGEIETSFKTKLADVGGVAKDGGTPAAKSGDAPKITSANSGLSEGAAKFANGLKLPA